MPRPPGAMVGYGHRYTGKFRYAGTADSSALAKFCRDEIAETAAGLALAREPALPAAVTGKRNTRPLDNFPSARSFGPLPRHFQFAALLLLALWLPTTMHCALESAELVSSSSICADGSNDHCAGDICAQLEDSLFKPQTDDLQVVAPDLCACACFLCLHLPPAAAPTESIVRPPNRPQNWITTWHFVRRAAPPSRAPALFCA